LSNLVERGAGSLDASEVTELILADHAEMERLLRRLRDDRQDREAVLRELADLLVGHAEAEEDVVYPTLERKADDEETEEEVAHGEEEHAEINEALLAVLEVGDVSGEEFDERLEELGEMVHHHLSEEERNVLNPARDNVSPQKRAALGEKFLEAREGLLAGSPGDVDKVRTLVEKARQDGLLDD